MAGVEKGVGVRSGDGWVGGGCTAACVRPEDAHMCWADGTAGLAQRSAGAPGCISQAARPSRNARAGPRITAGRVSDAGEVLGWVCVSVFV